MLSVFFIFFKQQIYYIALPVKFEDTKTPYVYVKIDGVTIPLEVDLGSRLEMKIYSDTLKKIHKRPYGTEKWKNFRGTEFEHPTFTLPKVEIGSLTFKNPIIVESPSKESEGTIIWEDPNREKSIPEVVGHIGRGLLKKVNLLLDMESSKIIFAGNIKNLKKAGYDLETFEKVPFELSPKGIIIEVDTDLGKMRFLLDTGFTLTTMHESLYPKDIEKKMSPYGIPQCMTSQFTINKTNFGSKDLYFLKMTEELRDIDGFLGMDFIKKHVIYINFSKNILYIK